MEKILKHCRQDFPVEIIVASLPRNSFRVIRSVDYLEVDYGDHREYVDERDDFEGLINGVGIQKYRKALMVGYLPYFRGVFEDFLATGADFFVLDGTSAIPPALMFKEAFRTSARLHPQVGVKIPKFVFLDAHPLKEKISDMERGNEDVDSYLDQLTLEAYRSLFQGTMSRALYDHSVETLSQVDEPKIIVFDEHLPNDPHTSGRALAEVIKHSLPSADVLAKGLGNQRIVVNLRDFASPNLFVTWCTYNPIKRRIEGDEHIISRPSFLRHPMAHKIGLESLRECKTLGILIGKLAYNSSN